MRTENSEKKYSDIHDSKWSILLLYAGSLYGKWNSWTFSMATKSMNLYKLSIIVLDVLLYREFNLVKYEQSVIAFIALYILQL